MKVIGSFDPTVLYQTRKNEVRTSSSFAAMLAFNIDNDPKTEDVTAVLGSNSAEVQKLYEQMTGKKANDPASGESKTVAFAFWSRKVENYSWIGESIENFDDGCVVPTKQMLRLAN